MDRSVGSFLVSGRVIAKSSEELFCLFLEMIDRDLVLQPGVDGYEELVLLQVLAEEVQGFLRIDHLVTASQEDLLEAAGFYILRFVRSGGFNIRVSGQGRIKEQGRAAQELGYVPGVEGSHAAAHHHVYFHVGQGVEDGFGLKGVDGIVEVGGMDVSVELFEDQSFSGAELAFQAVEVKDIHDLWFYGFSFGDVKLNRGGANGCRLKFYFRNNLFKPEKLWSCRIGVFLPQISQISAEG